MNNFRQWNPAAINQQDDDAYALDVMRTNGAVSGIFPSELANKLFYQCTTMISALAEALSNKGYNISDADISALITALSNILTKADFGTSAGTVCQGNDGRLTPVVDTNEIVKGSVDATKKVRFEVDGLTTGTTRVLTVPDKDITLVGTVDIPSDPEADTAGLRTLGTGALQACAGNDARLMRVFESDEQSALNSNTILTIAHGLGARPRFVFVRLRCKTAELGYSVGDETDGLFVTGQFDYASHGPIPVRADATNLYYAYGDHTPKIIQQTASIVADWVTITPANWRLVFRAIL